MKVRRQIDETMIPLSLSKTWIGTDEDKYEHIMPNDGGMQRFWREHGKKHAYQ